MGPSNESHVETVPTGDADYGHMVDQEEGEIHIRTYLLAFSISLAYFAQLVNIVGSGAYARTITSVVGGAADGVWLTSVLTICTVVLSPPISQAADYWGRKWFLVILTACGAIGCIVVSRAETIGTAIVGFTISGLSFGAQPLIHAIISEVVPRKHRGVAQGGINVSVALGAIFALLVGGALTRHEHLLGFRTYWYIAAAVYAAAALMCAVLYNPPPRELQVELKLREKLRRLDWVGYVPLTSGLVLFCLGLSWSQNPYSWTDAHILATFLTGTGLCIALGVYEWRFKTDGMFHHGLFGNRNFPIALACIFVEGLVFLTANNYFAFEISVLYTTDPLEVGLHYTVPFWIFAASAISSGMYCSRTKTVRLPTVVAFISFTIFMAIMASVGPRTPEANLWGYPVFLGIGRGVCLPALVTTAQFSTPPELIAITSGRMLSMRSIGGTLGLAVYTAIFSGSLGRNLAAKIAAATIPLGLPETSLGPLIGALTSGETAAVAKVPNVTPEIIQAAVGALLEAYSIAFRWVWVAAACFSAVAAILAFFIVDPSSAFNGHIDAPVEVVDHAHHSEKM
ncbi:hypothetical protein LTR08_003617 [Meristemomyces frigidus]|nr:hypothetical protein LTR08_003617 [Meristemomyces frigidus]